MSASGAPRVGNPGKSTVPEESYHVRLGLMDGEIKACLGYVPLEISIAGRVVRGAWLGNWMADPDQRQYGLGLLLMRQLMKEFEITLTVGANVMARSLFNRMGWTDFGPLPRYVCVLDASEAARLTENGTLDWPVSTGSEFSGLNSQLARDNIELKAQDAGSFSTGMVDRFDGDATQLWDREWGERVAGTRRSAEFLNWRYAEHAVLPYRLFEARRGGRLVGIAVYRIERVRDIPVRVGRIVELVAEGDAEEGLLDGVIEDARAEGVAVLDFFCTSARPVETLSRLGFLPGENEAAARIPMLFQPLDRRRSGILFLAYLRGQAQGGQAQGAAPTTGTRAFDLRALDWYVTKGDGDQDRPN
ncbi:MAG: hypothetical protein ACJ78Q_03985 [Chloroflexia bacterium]